MPSGSVLIPDSPVLMPLPSSSGWPWNQYGRDSAIMKLPASDEPHDRAGHDRARRAIPEPAGLAVLGALAFGPRVPLQEPEPLRTAFVIRMPIAAIASQIADEHEDRGCAGGREETRHDRHADRDHEERDQVAMRESHGQLIQSPRSDEDRGQQGHRRRDRDQHDDDRAARQAPEDRRRDEQHARERQHDGQAAEEHGAVRRGAGRARSRRACRVHACRSSRYRDTMNSE